MSKKVRVRFAPSPTGALHIGGVRTALYNYLFAKKHAGDFILRIEDTDQSRYVAGAEKYITNALEWCGIFSDESPEKGGSKAPYRQSERKDIYKKYVAVLIKKGAAYYAFDTSEALELERKNYEQRGERFLYHWKNRKQLDNSLSMDTATLQKRLASGEPYVIRFKIPANQTLTLTDKIRGAIQIGTNNLDDKVLFKSDGMPTYHLANVVDDHLMAISHVIRGEEWLPSMALHILLYAAFGWQPPEFAHLPLILKPTGKGKLSKRDGAKMGFPVLPLAYEDPLSKKLSKGFKQEGYFKEAFVNMLALLGWNDGTDREIFSMEQLIQKFSLERISKAGARFSIEKAQWFNAHYLQEKSDEELGKLFLPVLEQKGMYAPIEKVTKMIALTKERAVFVRDFWELGNYFFFVPKTYDTKSLKKIWKEPTLVLIAELLETLEEVATFRADILQRHIKTWIAQKKVGFGTLMQPLRLSLVGALKGVDIFKIMEFIGKEDSLQRIRIFINLSDRD